MSSKVSTEQVVQPQDHRPQHHHQKKASPCRQGRRARRAKVRAQTAEQAVAAKNSPDVAEEALLRTLM